MSEEIAIALPFNIDAYGKVNFTKDQRKIWADRVRSVIGTSLRERLMRPSFGTTIPFSLFEGSTEAMEEIEAEVSAAFSQQLKLLRLDQTNLTSDPITSEVSVEVVYRLPNNELVNTRTLIGRVVLDGANPIFEELL
jgi:phage baseplate assembly protein W